MDPFYQVIYSWSDENGLRWHELENLQSGLYEYAVTTTDVGQWGYGDSVSDALDVLAGVIQRDAVLDRGRQGRNYVIMCELCAERPASLVLVGYYVGIYGGDAGCCGDCFDHLPCPTPQSHYTVRAIMLGHDTAPRPPQDHPGYADVCGYPGCLTLILWDHTVPVRSLLCPYHLHWCEWCEDRHAALLIRDPGYGGTWMVCAPCWQADPRDGCSAELINPGPPPQATLSADAGPFDASIAMLAQALGSTIVRDAGA